MQILIGILLGISLILVSYSNSPLARHSVLSFVIRGNWTKGINLFSGIAVVVTFCIEYLAYLTLKMITLILVSLTDTKGETIFKLVRSFLNYAMFTGAVCLAQFFWVSTRQRSWLRSAFSVAGHIAWRQRYCGGHPGRPEHCL